MTPKRRTALLVGIAALLLLAVGVKTALIFAGRSVSLPTLDEGGGADPSNADLPNMDPSNTDPSNKDSSLEGIMELARSYQSYGDYDQALNLLAPVRTRTHDST